MEEKNKNREELIPPGPYCYIPDFTILEDHEGFPTVYCPYHTSKEINGVIVPWCNFLNQGGISNNTTEEEYEKLVEHFGDEDKTDEQLPLDLLWDSCKECGRGGDYNYTREEAIEWIVKIQKYEQ